MTNPVDVDISIIIPIFNEEKNIERYPTELIGELEKLNRSYEVIAVEDGSNKDNSWEALLKVSQKYPSFHILRHSRNYGMGGAYQSGFDFAKGKYIITFSADLEISPEVYKKSN